MIKPEDIKTINGLITAALQKFAKDADDSIGPELEQVKQALDGANKNILKLQAQVTAMKERAISNGLPRSQVMREEEEAFNSLIEEIKAQQKAAKEAAEEAQRKELVKA